MDMEFMRKRARVVAMLKDLGQFYVEYKQELQALQNACHHESVMQVDNSGMREQRVCAICGMKEDFWTEAKGGYVKLSAPLAVQNVSPDEFNKYKKFQELILVFVPKPKK
ncbi:MAG: hypothetical protein HZC14_01950 [Candidatus Niyogibacteria bacterium]|nr:hypothetical protein [Candidatus Niyogibacteria bacterium]